MDKTCETCKHFLRNTRKGGACAVHPICLDHHGRPHIIGGKTYPFVTYCTHKACSKYEEKELQNG